MAITRINFGFIRLWKLGLFTRQVIRLFCEAKVFSSAGIQDETADLFLVIAGKTYLNIVDAKRVLTSRVQRGFRGGAMPEKQVAFFDHQCICDTQLIAMVLPGERFFH